MTLVTPVAPQINIPSPLDMYAGMDINPQILDQVNRLIAEHAEHGDIFSMLLAHGLVLRTWEHKNGAETVRKLLRGEKITDCPTYIFGQWINGLADEQFNLIVCRVDATVSRINNDILDYDEGVINPSNEQLILAVLDRDMMQSMFSCLFRRNSEEMTQYRETVLAMDKIYSKVVRKVRWPADRLANAWIDVVADTDSSAWWFQPPFFRSK